MRAPECPPRPPRPLHPPEGSHVRRANGVGDKGEVLGLGFQDFSIWGSHYPASLDMGSS